MKWILLITGFLQFGVALLADSVIAAAIIGVCAGGQLGLAFATFVDELPE